ncbi:MAG: galactose oxidase [Undibacterium sp.]|nr:galactose oxidase [Opitutaceae bacterium]
MPSSSPWKQLAPLPDHEGFASPFVGVAGGALIVAGGANFPEKRPWEGGAKIWYDYVFALAEPSGAWVEAGRLPRANAYGVAVSAPAGMICAGGGDAKTHFAEVFLLTWEGRVLKTSALRPLPRACAFGSGALVGGIFYLAGGIEMPDATSALATLWALDMAQPEAGWKELPACPGPARMLAVAGATADTFYLFGGVALSAGADGRAQRTPLRDAYAYSAAGGWRKLADLPRAATAAPSPAPLTREGKLLVISGDDGLRAHLNGPDHPGFTTDILAYDPSADRWSEVGGGPVSRATAATVAWRGGWVVASGERKPGYRSPEAWWLDGDAKFTPDKR